MKTLVRNLLRTMTGRRGKHAGPQEPPRRAGAFLPPSGMIDLVLRKICLRTERRR